MNICLLYAQNKMVDLYIIWIEPTFWNPLPFILYIYIHRQLPVCTVIIPSTSFGLSFYFLLDPVKGCMALQLYIHIILEKKYYFIHFILIKLIYLLPFIVKIWINISRKKGDKNKMDIQKLLTINVFVGKFNK